MSEVPRKPLADQADRDRFITGLTSNFGVVAPAGVGKTHSIVSRIVALAQQPNAVEALSSLVVVTYTNRAAQEMQRRARAEILAQAGNLEIVGAFNRAFFGTIHSFCLRLLQSYGHYIGVPARAQLLEDDAELWNRFSQTQTHLGDDSEAVWVEKVLRHVPVTTIFDLARKMDPRILAPEISTECPSVQASHLLSFTPEKKIAVKKIEQDKAALQRWMTQLNEQNDFLPLLEPTSSSAAFVEAWQMAMDPLRRWLRCGALRLAVRLARQYQEFRVTSGFLTFQDQITLAADLLSNTYAARLIRRENYRIILDEAQDTDPEQFFVLMESGKHPDEPAEHPRAGHFAMVGDHQQSIYGRRADLPTYQRLHHELTGSATGQEARFAVTFRCAEKIVDFVNASFPQIFTGEEGQVSFVPLQARPAATVGQVVRVPIDPGDQSDEKKKISEYQRARIESKQIVAFVKRCGLTGLRAREWGQVAILCPRKLWFGPLVAALKAEGLDCQLHSVRETAGDSPVYAWFCALIWVIAHPLDGYEVVGVLREIFGLSDHDLAVFAAGRENIFQLDRDPVGNGVAADRLRLLAELRRVVVGLPLRDAVRKTVENVQLRERLKILTLEETAEEIEQELDSLLIYAAMVEDEGGQLRDFAQRLKDGFSRPRETETTHPGAIQIMTCQKAKGLEWDAVIVPFMFRKISSAPTRYPLFRKGINGADSTVFLSGEDADEASKEAVKHAERLECERILYVTCTRARQTLVLADDRTLFDGKAEDYWTLSFGNLLIRPTQSNEPLWLSLSTEVSDDQVIQAVATVEQSEWLFGENSEAGSVVDLGKARQQAGDFPRRITPHALATHFSAEEPEVRLEEEPEQAAMDGPTPATIYGTWWHELMESIPWNDSRERWQEQFERNLPRSIDAERSSREWGLFLESDLAAMLNRSEWIFQAEMPFLWRMDSAKIVEGVMDLAGYDPASDAWWVIDWKTNHLRSGVVTELAEIYQAQVGAYQRALRELFQKPVHGILYSTTLGQHHVLPATM